MKCVARALAVAVVLALAAPAGAASLFITNTKSNSISIIDTDTFEVTGTIGLGPGKPNRIMFHPDGKQAWVVYDKSHDLGVVDAATRKLVRRVKIGGNPYNLNFSPDGRFLYVLDWSSDTSNDEVIAWDLKGEKIDWRLEVSTWPAHSVFSRDGRLFYVSGETAGDLTVIDTTTRTAVARVIHGGGDAMGLALTADGKILYAGAGANKAVLKIDTATNTQTASIAMPGVVHETTLTLDGKYLYVTLRKANKVVVVSTADDKIVKLVDSRGYPDLITMEPSGRYAFVTNRYADAVSVIDVATHKEVRRIQVGKAPHGMALRPVEATLHGGSGRPPNPPTLRARSEFGPSASAESGRPQTPQRSGPEVNSGPSRVPGRRAPQPLDARNRSGEAVAVLVCGVGLP